MDQNNEENLNLFSSITECDNVTARAYLSRHASIDDAFREFFAHKSASASSTSRRISFQFTSQSTGPNQITNTTTSQSQSRGSSRSPDEDVATLARKVKKVKKVKEKKNVTSKTTKKATEPKEQRLKKNFSELISHSIKEDLNEEQRKKDWPKFLGSLKVECQAFYFFASSTISKIAPGKKNYI